MKKKKYNIETLLLSNEDEQMELAAAASHFIPFSNYLEKKKKPEIVFCN